MENGSIKFMRTKAPPQEKSTTTSCKRTDDGQVQIYTSGDMRWKKAVLMHQVRNQHVIKMTTVAGYKYDLMTQSMMLKVFKIIDLDIPLLRKNEINFFINPLFSSKES